MTNGKNPASSGIYSSSSTIIRFVSLSLVFLTIVGLAAMAYFTEREIGVSRDWVIHTYQVQSQLRELQLEMLRSRTHENNYFLMGQQSQAAQFHEQSDLARQTIEGLRKLTSDNPHQQQSLNQIAQLFEPHRLLEQGAGTNGKKEQIAPTVERGRSATETQEHQIDGIVNSMLHEEESLLQERLNAWDYLFRRNVLMLGLAFVIVTLMIAYNFRRLVAEVALIKKIEHQAHENAKSYRLMSARILELQDSERRKIARELHDSVGQYLAGLKINLDRLEASIPGDCLPAIREAAGMTEYAIQEVRTISHLLHPPLLEELGFLSAARWYVDEYGKRSQVQVSLQVDEPVERLPRDVEIALFRVLQESLTNVYRHAAAKTVDVRIVCRDGRVLLRVTDDGKGVPEEVLSKFRSGAAPGIGLAGMRERLAEFGGEIRVEASSRGSVVEAVIPTNACAIRQENAAAISV